MTGINGPTRLENGEMEGFGRGRFVFSPSDQSSRRSKGEKKPGHFCVTTIGCPTRPHYTRWTKIDRYIPVRSGNRHPAFQVGCCRFQGACMRKTRPFRIATRISRSTAKSKLELTTQIDRVGCVGRVRFFLFAEQFQIKRRASFPPGSEPIIP